MLVDSTIQELLERTASPSPVPGGGSMAALSASIAASLTEMVANLTIGKKGYEAVEREMKSVAKDALLYRKKFSQDIDRDANAYSDVIAAFNLPKDTPKEKQFRQAAIQNGLQQAALIPLDVAKDATKLMLLIAKVVEKGNKNAVTDGAVAAMMARTAALSAIYNVKTNLNVLKDQTVVQKVSKQIEKLEAEVANKEKEILALVDL